MSNLKKSIVMKNLFFVLCIVGIMYSCSSDNNIRNNPLTGTWKLSEINNDPGDGSGTIHAVQSDKVLEFGTDNKVSSNGDVYANTIDADLPSSGLYKFNDGSATEGIIISSEKDFSMSSSISIRFEVSGKILYVYYPCMEGCTAKYKKINKT